MLADETVVFYQKMLRYKHAQGPVHLCAYLSVTTALGYFCEEEVVMAAPHGRLATHRVMCAVVYDDVLEVAGCLLTYGCHGTHMHDGSTVPIKTNHLKKRHL